MPEGVVVSPTISSLVIIIRFESYVVLYNIMSYIHESVTKHMRASFRHTGLLSLKVIGLVNRRGAVLQMQAMYLVKRNGGYHRFTN